MTYIPSNEEEKLFLDKFDASLYRNPAVAADIALFAMDGNAIKILLIKRGGYPYKGKWALPGGFVNIDEDIKDAAERELFEETVLSGLYLEQAFTWGRPDRDPRQRVITVSYISFADFSKVQAYAGDDAAQAEWFTIKSYKKTEKGGITSVEYTLSGPEVLRPSVRFPTGRIQLISREKSGGLAFDHAESVVYSFELLKQKAKEGAFLEFVLKDADTVDYAKKVISGI